MLDFRGVSVHYGHQDVLSGVSFRVNRGDRVGVVGPNGSGKSTLFKIILGEMTPDEGDLVVEGSPRIGFTRQNPEPASPQETLLEYSLRGIPGLSEMEKRIHELENAAAGGQEGSQAILKELGELQTKFEHLGGYDIETRVKVALGGLGFSADGFDRPFASFSGGWRMRAELSRVLASKPDLLLLDEPSNYLDLPAVEWLQKFLKSYDGTLMLISHDRFLLRTLTGIIVEVDAGTAVRYEGGLDYYLRERDVPCLIYQGRLNMLDREPQEEGILQLCHEEGVGFISFSPLAQGLLTDRYLNGIPEDSRMSKGKFLRPVMLTDEVLQKITRWNEVAASRGETLAEMALAWILHQQGVTSVLVGASSTAQLEKNLRCVSAAPFEESL